MEIAIIAELEQYSFSFIHLISSTSAGGLYYIMGKGSGEIENSFHFPLPFPWLPFLALATQAN